MRTLAVIAASLLLAACASQVSSAEQDCLDRGGVYHTERQECFGAEPDGQAEDSERPSAAAQTPDATPRRTPGDRATECVNSGGRWSAAQQECIFATPEPTRAPTPPPTPTPAPLTWDERLAAAKNVAYDELFRNSDDHLFEDVYFRGEVIQVLGDSGLWNLRVNVTPGEYGFWDDTVFIEFYGDQRYLEDDIIDFVGTFTGPYTYESVMGGEVTIPGILIMDDTGIRLVE